jgi:hypothetical protein
MIFFACNICCNDDRVNESNPMQKGKANYEHTRYPTNRDHHLEH